MTKKSTTNDNKYYCGVFDIETDNLLNEVTQFYCGTVALLDKNLETVEVREFTDPLELTDVLEECEYIAGHNIVMYDLPALLKLGFIDKTMRDRFVSKSWDTLIGANQVFPNIEDIDRNTTRFNVMLRIKEPKLVGSHSLKAYGIRLGEEKLEFNDFTEYTPEMQVYCTQDVMTNVKLLQLLVEEDSNCFSTKGYEYERSFCNIVTRQQMYGVYYDVDNAENIASELKEKTQNLLSKIRETFEDEVIITPKNYKRPPKNLPKGVYFEVDEAGEKVYFKKEVKPFSPTSTKQLPKYLKTHYDLELPVSEKGNPKTNRETLEPYSTSYPIIQDILEYKDMMKLIGMLDTGAKSWSTYYNPSTHRIHGSVNPLGAVTGRCTHNSPNLAQVPARGMGAVCRTLFKAPEGKKIVGVDASGLELRVMAHYLHKYDNGEFAKSLLEGDKELGTDIHTINQHKWGVDSRDVGKTLTYATIYGSGNTALARMLDTTIHKAGKMKDNFLNETPALKEVMNECQQIAKTTKLINRIDGLKSYTKAEHSSTNVLFQGAGAIIMKWFTVNLDKRLQESLVYGEDYEFILNVHDENQLEVTDDEEIIKKVRDCIAESWKDVTEQLNLNIPIEGESVVGDNWSETH